MCPRAHHEADVRKTTRNNVGKHTRTTRRIQVPKSSSGNVAATEGNGEPPGPQRFSIRPVCKSDLGAANFGRDLVLPKWTCTARIASLRENTSVLGNRKPPTSIIQRKRAWPKGSAPVLLIIRIEKRLTLYESSVHPLQQGGVSNRQVGTPPAGPPKCTKGALSTKLSQKFAILRCFENYILAGALFRWTGPAPHQCGYKSHRPHF